MKLLNPLLLAAMSLAPAAFAGPKIKEQKHHTPNTQITPEIIAWNKAVAEKNKLKRELKAPK
jgi:hypothetical protein